MTTDPTQPTDVLAIWAEATNRAGNPVMGVSKTNGLPWPPLASDLKHFREATRDRVLIMGRKTLQSLPDSMKTPEATFERPLIVLTHQTPGRIPLAFGAYWYAGDLESFSPWVDPIGFARAVYPFKGVAVIGGPSIIETLAPLVNRVSVTQFLGSTYEGDVPAPDRNAFQKSGGGWDLVSTKYLDRDNLIVVSEWTRSYL